MRVFIVFTLAPAVAWASDCAQTSVGLEPINELGAGMYLGQYEGGLYPNGSNAVPAMHDAAGLDAANGVQPLASNGQPDPDGAVVLLSIGMSNASQEYEAFEQLAAAHDDVEDQHLVILNGAQGGAIADDWRSPTAQTYDNIENFVLNPAGVSAAQVQAVWVKNANANPGVSLPNADADAFHLLEAFGDIARALRTRYPNLRVAFLSSRTYGGYASTTLNPEPFAYESGFSVKWTIEAQIEQHAGMGVDPRAGNLGYPAAAPWLTWGPYLWADGETTRSDGLQWFCSDFENDGTHPSTAGEMKVGQLLLDFFLTSPYTVPWFTKDGTGGEPEVKEGGTGGGFYEEGETITLGLPAPFDSGAAIQWFRNGTPLAESARIQGVNDPQLQIFDAQIGDTGTYSATFDDGTKAASVVFITVTVVEAGALPAAGITGLAALIIALSAGFVRRIRRSA